MTTARKEIIILSSVALGSMVVGFLVVLLVLGPGESTTLPDPFEGDPGAAAGTSPHGEGGKAGGPAGGAVASDEAGPAEKSKTAQPPPAESDEQAPEPASEPPAPTPSSGALDLAVGDPFIWRCWPADGGDHIEKDACGTLPGIEPLVTEQLGTIEKCLLDHVGQSATGKLSLALRVDFDDGSVKAWLGNSTTIDEMADVSACINTGYATVVPPPISHTHPRYVVFFNVMVNAP